MESRSAIFAVPGSTGVQSFNIVGWSETPVACTIHLIGTDAADGFDNTSVLSFGVVDSVGGDFSVGVTDTDNLATSDTQRIIQGDAIVRMTEGGSSALYTGAFSAWETGGIELNFTGSPDATEQLLITFFSGDDVLSKAVSAQQDEHIESIGFASKMILTGCTGMGFPGGADHYILTLGVCTNGDNGLTQNYIASSSEWDAAATNASSYLGTGKSSSQLHNKSISWESSIGSIDADGFTLSGSSGSDDLIALCLTFDEDVDSGYDTIPTSGDISITDPGFTPQVVGVVVCNNTALDTVKEAGNILIGVGVVDSNVEHSVHIVTEDYASTINATSVHSSSVIHGEDADQTEIFDAELDAFTATGFDLTVNTNPATATYFIWWAIEEPTPDSSKFRTYAFDAPDATGNRDFVIPGWTMTPKAAKFVLVRTDATDGYDDHAGMALGFTDGTTDAVFGTVSQNGVGTSNCISWHNETYCIQGLNPSSQASEIAAAFVSWQTGGVRLNFSAVETTYKIMATFFAGSDVQAHVGTYEMSAHVEDIGFTSKLIFSMNGDFTTASGFGTLDDTWGTYGMYGDGLGQHVTRSGDDGVGTTNTYLRFNETISTSGGSWVDIENIDSAGFEFDHATSTELCSVLALTFDNAVDCDWDDIPTSGDISDTYAGFVPQIMGGFFTRCTTRYTANLGGTFSIGEADAYSEHSVGIDEEDDVSTTNTTSNFYENLLHVEDASQSVLANGVLDAFTADGFDITMDTWPGSAFTYFTWAIEEDSEEEDGPIIGNITGDASVVGAILGDGALAGVITGDAATVGAILGNGVLAGIIAGDASTTGALLGSGALGGVIAGDGSVTGTILGAGVLAGGITGDGSTTGTILGAGALSGSITGDASIVGNGVATNWAIGNITGDASASGTILGAGALASSITGDSTASSTLLGAGELAGSITGDASTTSTLLGDGALAGVIAGDSTASSTGTAIGALAGVIAGDASVVGGVLVLGTLASGVTGDASVTGAIIASGGLAASITGDATASGVGILRGIVVGTQYITYYNDLLITPAETLYTLNLYQVRKRILGNAYYIDVTTTPLGFSGDENTDWEWVAKYTGQDSDFRSGVRDGNFVVDCEIDGGLFPSWLKDHWGNYILDHNGNRIPLSSGVEDTDWENLFTTSGSGSLTIYRDGIREYSYYVIDKELTTLGFSGTEGAGDWENLVRIGIAVDTGMIGAIAGDASVSGTILAEGAIAGGITGDASILGTLLGAGELAGSISGDASVTGTTLAIGELVGPIAGDASTTGALVATAAISGNIAGDASASATLLAAGALAGSIVGDASITGGLSGAGALASSISGDASVTAYLQGGGVMTANITGDASVTLTGAARRYGTGTITGDATVSGTIVAAGGLAGNIVGDASTSGTILGEGALAGSITGDATASAIGQTQNDILGDIVGDASVTGALIGAGALAGAVTGDATTLGTILGSGALEGDITGDASVVGGADGVVAAAGIISGDAVASATLLAAGALAGSITGDATVTGTTLAVGELAGAISGDASAQAIVLAIGVLASSITGTATIVGGADEVVAATGSITGTATASSTLIGAGALVGNITGNAAVTATGTADGIIGALIGTGAVTGTLSGGEDGDDGDNYMTDDEWVDLQRHMNRILNSFHNLSRRPGIPWSIAA